MDVSQEVAPALLQLARMNTGMTQRQVAAAAGLPTSMVSAYERGVRQPTMPTLLRLLRACGQEVRLHLAPLDPQDLLSAESEQE